MSDTEGRELAEAHKYPHVVRFVRETPWAILETTMRDINEMVALRASGQRFTDEEIQARIGSGTARRDAASSGPVAVIPIYGVITPRADMFTDMSGGTSIDRLQQSLRAAVNDSQVSSILLDVNSPGGSVSMLSEMAAEIRAARSKKPVVAIANTMAASAAYQLGSQASEFVVTPSGTVGSIGVIAGHDDVSAALEMEGIKTTIVTAGKYKGELSPFAPLSDEAKAEMQSKVDAFYAMFVSDVARGRGVPVDRVRSEFGQGRMLLAKDALAAGMVDEIATFDATISRLERNAAPKTAAPTRSEGDEEPPGDEPDTKIPEAAVSGSSFADEAEALHGSAEALLERTRSLAELRDRGRLGPSKRDRLAACTGALRETVTALEGVLAATAPVNHSDQAAGEFARFLARQTEGARR